MDFGEGEDSRHNTETEILLNKDWDPSRKNTT